MNEVRRAIDLPPGRQEAYVWRHCWLPGFSLTGDLDDMGPLGHSYQGMCGEASGVLERLPTPERAVRGRDGLFHLEAGGHVVCERFVQGRRCGAGQAERDEGSEYRDLTGVPQADRCPVARGYWPPATASGGALATVRGQLVEAFGRGCATCPNPYATKVDHHHVTGRVRGFLCGICNDAMDRCRHRAGCRYAEYAENPPAAALDLGYPGHARLLATRLQRRAELFELVMAGEVSPVPDYLLERHAQRRDLGPASKPRSPDRPAIRPLSAS